MKKVDAAHLADFGGSVRKYFDFNFLRILTVEHYADMEDMHLHNKTSQILYVINGRIKVIDDQENEIIVNKDEFIHIPIQEFHKVSPVLKNTKILVIKYIDIGTNNIHEIKSDWVRYDH